MWAAARFRALSTGHGASEPVEGRGLNRSLSHRVRFSAPIFHLTHSPSVSKELAPTGSASQPAGFSQRIAVACPKLAVGLCCSANFQFARQSKRLPYKKNAVWLRQAGPTSARTGRQKTQSARRPPNQPPGRSLPPGKAEPRQIKVLQRTARQLTD